MNLVSFLKNVILIILLFLLFLLMLFSFSFSLLFSSCRGTFENEKKKFSNKKIVPRDNKRKIEIHNSINNYSLKDIINSEEKNLSDNDRVFKIKEKIILIQ